MHDNLTDLTHRLSRRGNGWTRVDERKVTAIIITYTDGSMDTFAGIEARLRRRVNISGGATVNRGGYRKTLEPKREYDEYEIAWSSPTRPVTIENGQEG